MTTHNGFFAVGQDTFIAACSLGMNPACALLVMACGTGKDNATTRWSAEAVGNHVGVRWTTAKEAIEALCSAGLVAKGGKPARPSYKLHKAGELIWLPKTLVEGAANETAPVAKLRQSQDPMALRLLVELYLSQNLREDGGVSTKITWKTFERRQAGQHGSYLVWDFTNSKQWVSWTGPALPHLMKNCKDGEKGRDFFQRFAVLLSLGLVEWVPYLYDGPKGEPMHPMAWQMPIENELYDAATQAAARMLGESWAQSIEGIAVPVQKHIAEAALIGVARLKYRPHTALTSAWWVNHQATCAAFTEQYNALAAPPKAVASPLTGLRNGSDNCPF